MGFPSGPRERGLAQVYLPGENIAEYLLDEQLVFLPLIEKKLAEEYLDPRSEMSIWMNSNSNVVEKINTAKSWLAVCMAEHPECNPRASSLPKRLIHVGSGSVHPRLILTECEMGVCAKMTYATLSHCWGNHMPLRAKKDNLEELSDHFALDSLPLSFRDAIMICRALCIPYIWIDSLCIVQDDEEEWCAEAARMNDIYSGGILNIAASDATCSLDGCFTNGHGTTNRAQEAIQVTKTFPGSDSALKIRILSGDVRQNVGHTTLSTRGWVLQEQILSHRVLHCMHPEVHWQCRRTYQTESGGCFNSSNYHSLAAHSLPQNLNPPALHEIWCLWMEDYSLRYLTFARDQIRALAGVVQHFSNRSGYKHVLGCWEETMLTDLIWVRTGARVDRSKMLANIPTWSWLSRCEQVYFDFWRRRASDPGSKLFTNHTIIVRAEVSWQGTPLLSDIEATNLVLEGPVQQFKLTVPIQAKEFNPPYMNIDDEILDNSVNPIPWKCAAQFDDGIERGGSLFTCLLMRSSPLTIPGSPDELLETFLILLPTEGGSSVENYQRVGIGSFRAETTMFKAPSRKKIRLL